MFIHALNHSLTHSEVLLNSERLKDHRHVIVIKMGRWSNLTMNNDIIKTKSQGIPLWSEFIGNNFGPII